MENLALFDPILVKMDCSQSIESIQFPTIQQFVASDSSYECEEQQPSPTPKRSNSKTGTPRSHHVTTIQEYTQLVIACMRKCKKMNTTEVAKSIMGSVRPRTTKLTVNIRRRVGDALSVLAAIRLVEKQGNGYIWTGNRSSSNTNEINNLRREVEEMKRILNEKQNQYKALQDKEKELRLLSSDESQQSSSLSSDVSSVGYCTQNNDDEWEHAEELEVDSPRSVHFNAESDFDNLQHYPFFLEEVPQIYPSISFPDFVFERDY